MFVTLVVRCATSRTVPGLIRVTGFFGDVFPSDRTMALGSTQSLVKMSTRNIPGGKGGRCVRLTTYRHTVPLSRNLGALTSQNPVGLFRPVTGQPFTLVVISYISGNTMLFLSNPTTESIRTTTLSVVTTEYIKPLKSETCPNKI